MHSRQKLYQQYHLLLVYTPSVQDRPRAAPKGRSNSTAVPPLVAPFRTPGANFSFQLILFLLISSALRWPTTAATGAVATPLWLHIISKYVFICLHLSSAIFVFWFTVHGAVPIVHHCAVAAAPCSSIPSLHVSLNNATNLLDRHSRCVAPMPSWANTSLKSILGWRLLMGCAFHHCHTIMIWRTDP